MLQLDGFTFLSERLLFRSDRLLFMKQHNIDSPVRDNWIKLTEENPNTYNSSSIRGIRWQQSSKVDEYDITFGVLLIRFQNTGTYVYDLPYEVFEELAHRAFVEDDGGYARTTGEWYNDLFERKVRELYRKEGVEHGESLYIDTSYQTES